MGILGRLDGAEFGDERAAVQAIRMGVRLCVEYGKADNRGFVQKENR